MTSTHGSIAHMPRRKCHCSRLPREPVPFWCLTQPSPSLLVTRSCSHQQVCLPSADRTDILARWLIIAHLRPHLDLPFQLSSIHGHPSITVKSQPAQQSRTAALWDHLLLATLSPNRTLLIPPAQTDQRATTSNLRLQHWKNITVIES